MCFHRVVNYYEANGTKSLGNGGQRHEMTINDIALCNPITNVSVCYRRGVFGELPEWMDRVTSYDPVMHLLTLQYGKVYYMHRVMAVYRKLATSIWTGGDKARRAEISRKNRDLLIGYFADRNPEVCDILRRANALNCIDMANSMDDCGKHEEAGTYLQMVSQYKPDWSPAEIYRYRHNMTKSQRPRPMRRLLTACRAFVSKFIPLPRIR